MYWCHGTNYHVYLIRWKYTVCKSNRLKGRDEYENNSILWTVNKFFISVQIKFSEFVFDSKYIIGYICIKNQENHGMFIYTDNWFWFNAWFIYGV